MAPLSPFKDAVEARLADVEAEYNSCKARLDMVADPAYLPDLKQRLLSLDLKIKKITKHRKTIETAQKKNDKKLMKVDEEEPELSQELNSLKKELAITEKKLHEQEATTAKQETTLQELETKAAEAKTSLDKITGEAGELAIDTKAKKPGTGNIKFEELEGKCKGLEKTLILYQKRSTMSSREYSQHKAERQIELDAIAAQLQAKNEYSLS
jgi:chromosome segregation ATPase